MTEAHPTGAGAEELADLAWMVDCAVHFGERGQAATLAGRLLEELSRHYRAMRPLRLRCAPHVGAALADEAFALIGDVEQIANASPESIERALGGRGQPWPNCGPGSSSCWPTKPPRWLHWAAAL